jgi:hypothetical protein
MVDSVDNDKSTYLLADEEVFGRIDAGNNQRLARTEMAINRNT